MTPAGYALTVLTAWNIVVFLLYGIDKAKARRGARRIPEKTLLLAAALMGAPGALAGIYLFRHKTKHTKFTVGVPLLLVLNIAAAALYLRGVPMELWDKPAVYTKISADEARAMMAEGDVLLLDVRTAEEFDETHIEGAILIPYDELAARAATELPDKKACILIYCRSGRRSEIAARELVSMGYRQVYDFGGLLDWA